MRKKDHEVFRRAVKPAQKRDRPGQTSRSISWHWRGWGGTIMPPATGRRCATRQPVCVINGRREYLLGMPLVGDFLEEGPSMLGYSCEDWDLDHLQSGREGTSCR